MAGDGRDKGPNMMADVCIFSQENIHPCMMMSGMAEGSVDPASNAFGSGPYNKFNGSSRGVARVRQGSIEDNRLGVDYYASGKQTAGDHNSSSSENLESGMKYGHRLGNENHAS